MNELALFAGAGGGILAGKLLGWTCVCAVEKEPYAQAALLARQADGILEPFPIWDDARTFNGRPWRGCVDVVSAGFPCQPWSSAGKREGEFDPRNLWPTTLRIIRAVRPTYCVFENVDELASQPYFARIIRSLEKSGYVVPWPRLAAAEDVGAPHERLRLWFVAYDPSQRWGKGRPEPARQQGGFEPAGRHLPAADDHEVRRQQAHGQQHQLRAQPSIGSGDSQAAHASAEGLPLFSWSKVDERARKEQPPPCGGSWWDAEPGVGRVVHGLAHRVDRIAALGNGQVPFVAAREWAAMIPELDCWKNKERAHA